MKRIRIYPYNQGSRSAKALAVALGGKVLRRVGSKYRRRPQDIIINWGAFDSPYRGAGVLNQPDSIQTARNKLTCLTALVGAGIRVPPFWTKLADIPYFDANEFKYPIVCRKLLTASEGRGIVIATTHAELVEAPLYTQYIKKKDEYRVHVLRTANGDTSIISVSRKARRFGEGANFQIQNLDNGFVFVRGGFVTPDDVLEQAQAALVACGLDFGAVDVIWNQKQQKAYVLEINTAPGLAGKTVEDYVNALQNLR